MQTIKILIGISIFIILTQKIYSIDNIVIIDDQHKISISIVTGLLAFDESLVTNIRHYTNTRLPFSTKITDDFPSNPIMQFELLLLNKRFEFGLCFSNYSTGSRTYYADYSGEYKHDIILTNLEYGIIFKTKQIESDFPIKVHFCARIGRADMSIKSDQYLRIYNEFNRAIDEFNNTTLFSEVGIRLNYNFSYFKTFAGIAFYYEPYTELNNGMSSIRGNLGVGMDIFSF